MSPSVNHSLIQATLVSALLSLKQYSVYSELSVEIEGKEYVPDISVYSKRKFNPLNDEIKIKEIPLLIIEILSPTQIMQELVEKIKIYINSGVKSCWLVVPVTCSITVFSNLERSTTYSQNKVVDEKLNISIPLDEIFPF